MNYLSDVLEPGDLVFVLDDGYEGCHLGFFIAKAYKIIYVQWLDGRGNLCRLFRTDFDRRFKPVAIKSVSEEVGDDAILASNISAEDIKQYGWSVAVGDLRIYLRNRRIRYEVPTLKLQ